MRWGQVGNVSLGTISVALTGVNAEGIVGRALVPLVSNNAVGEVGSVNKALTVALTGAVGSGAVQSVNVLALLGLTGVAATGSVGNVLPVYWKPIPDNTDANWQNITGEPSTVWSLLGTDAPANWQNIGNEPTTVWGNIDDNVSADWEEVETV